MLQNIHNWLVRTYQLKNQKQKTKIREFHLERLVEQVNGYCERAGFELWAEPINAVTNMAFLQALLRWAAISKPSKPKLARATPTPTRARIPTPSKYVSRPVH